MRTKIWVAPDYHRYTVTTVREPFDDRLSVIFQRHEDGWIGAASVFRANDLRDIPTEELVHVLARAKVYRGP